MDETLPLLDAESATPCYLIEEHEGGGVRIRRVDEATDKPLFDLDQILFLLEQRLPEGHSLVLGGQI